MAKKERNRRSARQARSAARAEREQIEVLSASEESKGTLFKRTSSSDTSNKPAKKPAKTGIFGRFRNYIASVRTEMRKVVWPSPEELRNYTLSTIAILIVAGIVVWLVDTGIVAGLLGITGLRG